MLSVTATTAFGQNLEHMTQAGGMTGVATPLNLADAGANTIEIKLALDADLFPPDFDVAKMAFLERWKGDHCPRYRMERQRTRVYLRFQLMTYEAPRLS